MAQPLRIKSGRREKWITRKCVFDILESVKARFSNTFVNSFLLAWSIWNFSTLLVIFSDSSTAGGWQAKLQYFEKIPYWNWILNGYAIPAMAALVWIFLLPPLCGPSRSTTLAPS